MLDEKGSVLVFFLFYTQYIAYYSKHIISMNLCSMSSFYDSNIFVKEIVVIV